MEFEECLDFDKLDLPCLTMSLKQNRKYQIQTKLQDHSQGSPAGTKSQSKLIYNIIIFIGDLYLTIVLHVYE